MRGRFCISFRFSICTRRRSSSQTAQTVAKIQSAVLIPGGRVGVWLAGSLGFLVVLMGIALSLIPPGEAANKWLFEAKLIGGTGLFVLIGLFLYWRGSRQKMTNA